MTYPPFYSLDLSSKKKDSSLLSFRSLVTTVASFFIFAPVVLAVCAPNSISTQPASTAVIVTANGLSQNNRIAAPSASPRLTSHCVLLDLLQLSDGILPSHSSISPTSRLPDSGRAQTRKERSSKTPFYILSLDLSDSYRYKPATLFDQRVLLRV